MGDAAGFLLSKTARTRRSDPRGPEGELPSRAARSRSSDSVLGGVAGAATANVPLLVKGEVRTPLPFYVYRDGFENMPWAPSGWMGSVDVLNVDGRHEADCHQGPACIALRYSAEFGWVGVAWQHPPNNWGDMESGLDLTGAKELELWARGAYGGERVSIGVGLIERDKPHPDSAKKVVENIVLTHEWRR